MRTKKQLRLPAIAVKQSNGRTLYQFAVDGKLLDRFATVSRIHRDGDQHVQGYQRPESLQHIASIRRYIESDAPMIPNGIVIAFDKRVVFIASQVNRAGARAALELQGLLLALNTRTLSRRTPRRALDPQVWVGAR